MAAGLSLKDELSVDSGKLLNSWLSDKLTSHLCVDIIPSKAGMFHIHCFMVFTESQSSEIKSPSFIAHTPQQR